MAQNSDFVKKQTMYIGVALSIVVGFLAGVIFSSIQSTGISPQPGQQRQAQAPPAAQPGIDPQSASQILALEQQLVGNPNDVSSWTQLGNLYFDADRYSNAIRAYTKSIELRPGSANVLTDLGVMYRRNKQPIDAVESFKKAIAADPTHEQSKFNLGIILMYDLQDVQGAIEAWEELLKVNPNAVTGNGVSIRQVIEDARQQAK